MRVIATITANTSDERDELSGYIAAGAEGVRNEDGCRSYEVFTSGSRRIVLIEDWVDSDALGLHARSAQFRNLMARLEELKVAQSLQVLPLTPVG